MTDHPSQYSGGPSVDAMELRLSGSTALTQDFKRTAAVEVTMRGEIVGHTFDDKKDKDGNVTVTVKGIKLKVDELVSVEEIQRVRNASPGQTAVNDDGQVFDPATGEILDDQPVVDAKVVAELPAGDDEPVSAQDATDPPPPEDEPRTETPYDEIAEGEAIRQGIASSDDVIVRDDGCYHPPTRQYWTLGPEQIVEPEAASPTHTDEAAAEADESAGPVADPEPPEHLTGDSGGSRQHSGANGTDPEITDDGLIDGQIPRPVEPGQEYAQSELEARRRYLLKRPVEGPAQQAQADELSYIQTMLQSLA